MLTSFPFRFSSIYSPLALSNFPLAFASTMAAATSSTSQRGQVVLVDFVDWSGVECLNQDGSHSIANALKEGYRNDDGLHLASDSDEQLLIYIPFTQMMKLHCIVIKGPEEKGNEACERDTLLV